jgi:hypothetical protein
MPRWFSRAPEPDLITPGVLAEFGRYSLLGPDLSGVDDAVAVRAALDPISNVLYGGDDVAQKAMDEVRRHASAGTWEAVGGWKFAEDFFPGGDVVEELSDDGMRALAEMRIENLDIHLGPVNHARYERVVGTPVPNDKFWGPPVFASSFGPSRQYYYDNALVAKAARQPERIADTPSAAVPDLAPAAGALWDFGMLILRGPLMCAPDQRFERGVLAPMMRCAGGSDHTEFAARLTDVLDQRGRGNFNGWEYMGAARFVEDYLDETLTGGAAHLRFVDRGLEQLAGQGMLGREISPDALSAIERDRL